MPNSLEQRRDCWTVLEAGRAKGLDVALVIPTTMEIGDDGRAIFTNPLAIEAARRFPQIGPPEGPSDLQAACAENFAVDTYVARYGPIITMATKGLASDRKPDADIVRFQARQIAELSLAEYLIIPRFDHEGVAWERIRSVMKPFIEPLGSKVIFVEPVPVAA